MITLGVNIIYLLIACSTILLEKPTGSQLTKKFFRFYGTRRFITAFAATCPSSDPDQSSPNPTPSYFLKIYFNAILP
jgi:hypothetical protein